MSGEINRSSQNEKGRKFRLNIDDHSDMGGRFQLLLPAGYLLQVFALKLQLLGLDLVTQVNGFCAFCLEFGKRS